ncbi:MAG: thioredoxin domain-containing protein [Patescibacteria group bacterium]
MTRHENVLLSIIGGFAVLIIVTYGLSLLGAGSTAAVRPRVESTDPKIGAERGKVTLVVFTDFECEFCKAEVQILKSALGAYQNDVRLVFKDFPLPLHPNSNRASQIARCAQDQGEFWQMHDTLFDHQTELATISLEVLAQQSGTNAAQLQQCLESGQAVARVNAAIAEGKRLGIQEVPTMFVNDEQITGLVEDADLRQVIQKHL